MKGSGPILSFEHNIAAVERELTALERKEVPFATALALTKTAQGVKLDLEAEMRRVFDRPTPFTMRGLYVQMATKNDLRAKVYFRTFAAKGTPAGKYLQAQIFGGVRRQKGAERALARAGLMGNKGYFVPASGVKLNQYGNVPGSTIKAMLSDVSAGNAEQTIRKASAGRSKRRRSARYFVPRPGSKLQPGIWVRKGKTIQPALLFVASASYQPRFRFDEVARASAIRRFPREFDQAMTRALATSRTR